MLKPILMIDFDGTLCHDRFWKTLPPKLYARIQNELFNQNYKVVDEWMRGSRSAEELVKFTAELLKVDYEILWDNLVENCENMHIEKSDLEMIDALREKYITVLMTNNMDTLARFTVPALGLDKYFDHIVSSSERKILKHDNNGQLFMDVINELGSDIKTTILIDNSEKVNQIFESLGGKTYFVDKNKTLGDWLKTL